MELFKSLIVVLWGISIGADARVCLVDSHFTPNTSFSFDCQTLNRTTCEAMSEFLWQGMRCQALLPVAASANASCHAVGGTPWFTTCAQKAAEIESAVSTYGFAEFNESTCHEFFFAAGWSAVTEYNSDVPYACCGGNVGVCQTPGKVCSNHADFTPNVFLATACKGVDEATCNAMRGYDFGGGEGCRFNGDLSSNQASYIAACTAAGGTPIGIKSCKEIDAEIGDARPYIYNITDISTATCKAYHERGVADDPMNRLEGWHFDDSAQCCGSGPGVCHGQCLADQLNCPGEEYVCLKQNTVKCGDPCVVSLQSYEVKNWTCDQGDDNPPSTWTTCSADCKRDLAQIYGDIGCCSETLGRFHYGSVEGPKIIEWSKTACNLADPCPPEVEPTPTGTSSGIRTSYSILSGIIPFALWLILS